MNHAVGFIAFGVYAQSVGVVLTFELNNLTSLVANNFAAGHYITATQAHRLIWCQTFPFTGWLFSEIFLVDVQGLAPGYFPLAHVRVLGVERQHQGFGLVFRVVGQGHLQRAHHAHGAGCAGVQVFAYSVLQHAHIHGAASLVDANHVAKSTNRLRGIATAAHAGNGGHTGVVPAVHEAFIHQALEFALAGNGVVQVQPGKFDLARLAGGGDVFQHPVIKRPMVLEFQRAQGVSNPLHGVGNRMGEVVHRVDAPLVAGLVVVSVANPVEDRVPHVDIRGRHVDFGTQYQFAVLVFAVAHVPEQLQIFFHRTIPVRAVLSRLFQGAAVFGHLVGSQRAHVGLALSNQLNGKIVNGVEIIRGIAHLACPFVTQPVNILFDGVNVLLGFLFRVGIVKPQSARTVKRFGNAEVQADRLGVTDVQVTVGLRRKPCHYLACVLALGNGVFNQALDEVMGFL